MNYYSAEEVSEILRNLGANKVHIRSNSVRCACPIHDGDNGVGFAAWMDPLGIWRTTCFTGSCVSGSMLEWLAAKIHHTGVEAGTKWIAQLLGRNDLLVPTYEKDAADLLVTELPPICLYDNSAWKRLADLYPHHEYWKGRGYSEKITREYGLTFRSIDNRAVIPVTLDDGSFVGMMERTFDPDMPKYIWQSPNSEKGRFIFGAQQALARPLVIEGLRVVFMVEGTLDPIKAADEGFPVVASQTNRFSAAQAQSLIGNWDVVIVIPDQDEAGLRLTKDVYRHAGPFMNVAVYNVPPPCKDMDDYPQEKIHELLTGLVEQWLTRFKASSRYQRQRLMTLS